MQTESESEAMAVKSGELRLRLEDRTAIVTGGSRGIGRAIALQLAFLGYRLVIGYASNATQADLVVSEINSSRPSSSCPCAIAVRANTSVEEWDMVFSVNTCREVANRLARGGGGRIINLSTTMNTKPLPGAAEAMTKFLAKELKGAGITANCVAPGAIVTGIFGALASDGPLRAAVNECLLGRLGETRDVAPVVGFLATDDAEWVNGQVIRFNGGRVCLNPVHNQVLM